ncbi:O-antigen ligase family protein [Demequina sp. SO4-18]|uniref:O-antigen ligase family protein n=1 Tax=Demequina sp. SO4-18 TaxID=3401026 RepID=UPI003B58DB82
MVTSRRLTAASSLSRALDSERARAVVTIGAIVLLVSGQGFRYLLGLPAFAVMSVVTIVAVFVVFKPSLRSMRPPLLIGAFVGLAALSVVWSATRAVTTLAVVALVATTAIAIITARGASNTEFMVRLYRGLQVSLFLGIAFELVVAFVVRAAVPPLAGDLEALAANRGAEAIQSPWSANLLLEGGPIQGFVGNRNPFGAIALLAGIVAFVLLLDRRIRRVDGWVTLGAAGAVHVLTMSATVTASIVALAALTVGAYVLRRLRPRGKRVLSFTIIACAAIGSVLTLKYREELFALLERGSDFTNRTQIWYEVIDYAVQRPDGWGYVGYWPIWQYPYSEIGLGLEWVRPTHAHNAFLDAWLQLGLIGVVLLFGIVVLLFGSAWRLVERADRGDTHLPLGWALLTVALLLQALTESRLLVEGGWFLLVALFCMGPPVFTLTIVDPQLVHFGTRMREADEARTASRIDASEKRHRRGTRS